MPTQTEEIKINILQENKKYSYELTQQLTYFVVTAELALCGYMLLNAEKLTVIQGAPYLFLTCGLAAFMGIMWRFCYNITYHVYAHARNKNGELDFEHKLFKEPNFIVASNIQGYLHDFYVLFSIVCLLWILGAGFYYLL